MQVHSFQFATHTCRGEYGAKTSETIGADTLELKCADKGQLLRVTLALTICFFPPVLVGVPVVSSLKTRLLALQVLGAIMAEFSDTSPLARTKCTKVQTTRNTYFNSHRMWSFDVQRLSANNY